MGSVTKCVRNHTTGRLVALDPEPVPCKVRGCSLLMRVADSAGEPSAMARVRLATGPLGVTKYGILSFPAATIDSAYPHEAWLWECPKGHRRVTIDGSDEWNRVPNANATKNRWGQPYWKGYDRA